MSATAILTFPALPSLARPLRKPIDRPDDNLGELAPPLESLSDRGLLERVIHGDQDAFAVLYRRFEKPVFSILVRMTGQRALAEELLQESFTRVWLGAASHDPSRGKVKGWIYTIALNTARTELARKRHRTRHVSIDDLEIDLEGAGEEQVSKPLDDVQKNVLLGEALRTLPDFMQEVVILRCSRELSFAEISEITGAPEGTLKSRFHRAVKAMRQIIDARSGDARSGDAKSSDERKAHPEHGGTR